MRPPVLPLPNVMPQPRPVIPVAIIPPPIFGGKLLIPLTSPLEKESPSSSKRLDFAKLIRKDGFGMDSSPIAESRIASDSMLFLNPLARKPERPTTRERDTTAQAKTSEEARWHADFGDSELDRPAMPPLPATLVFLNPLARPIMPDEGEDAAAPVQRTARRSATSPTVELDLSRPVQPPLRDSLLLPL
jgi:hypothetical protein